MPNSLVYLKHSVQFEPLYNQWYAWGYLISPATAAMVTVNLHQRVLESFIRQPQLHRQAVANQAMRGGMYMEHAGELAPVEDLLAATRVRLAHCADFANGIKTLNDLLLQKSDGGSLAGLYPQVPEALKGLVELVYDLQSRPSFRLLESLLYDSEYYDERLQSVNLSLAGTQARPFVLSSPRFADPGVLNITMPLRAPAFDALFRMRSTPASLEEIGAQFGWSGMTVEQQALFASLFTSTAPELKSDRHVSGEGLRVRYFGHATVLVQTAGIAILIDPAIRYDDVSGQPGYALSDLPDRIDYVLLTHNHQDHVMLETLLQIRHKVACVVVARSSAGALQDPSLRLMLRAVGFNHVVELDEAESLPVPGGAIIGIPFFGEHADLDIRSKLAYGLQLEGRNLVFLADSNALEPRMYERIARQMGPVDAMFVGLECDGAPMSWLYGPLMTRPLTRSVDQARRLNSSDSASALAIAERLRARSVYVYAMGLEPWLGYISSIAYAEDAKPMAETRELVRRCLEQGRHAELLFIAKELHLPPGWRPESPATPQELQSETAQ